MDLFEKYYASALFYLQYRARSEKEIEDYLKKKNASDPIRQQVIAKLKAQKFLDDENFARMWIESRMRAKPRSQMLLKMELRRKGISDDVIRSVLQGEDVKVVDDTTLAIKLVEKKIRRYQALPKEQIYIKLGGLLSRNGFNWETAKRAIDEVLKEGYNTTERQ